MTETEKNNSGTKITIDLSVGSDDFDDIDDQSGDHHNVIESGDPRKEQDTTSNSADEQLAWKMYEEELLQTEAVIHESEMILSALHDLYPRQPHSGGGREGGRRSRQHFHPHPPMLSSYMAVLDHWNNESFHSSPPHQEQEIPYEQAVEFESIPVPLDREILSRFPVERIAPHSTTKATASTEKGKQQELDSRDNGFCSICQDNFISHDLLMETKTKTQLHSMTTTMTTTIDLTDTNVNDSCDFISIMTLPCSHRFHEDCILPWFASKNSCPTCKQSFSS